MLHRVLVLASFLAASASAGQVTHSVPFGPVPIGGSIATVLPQFDPTLGVLRTVRVEICPTMTGSVGYENTGAQPVNFGGGVVHVGFTLPWSIGALGYPPGSAEYYPPATSLSAYDGATDWAGTSGTTLNFTNHAGVLVCSSLAFSYDNYLDAYVGSGTVPSQAGPVTLSGIHPTGAVVHTVSFVVSGTFSVEYEFDAFPAIICLGQSWSGCPCGNFSGLPGGCRNSTGGFGAALAVSGSASISNDTLTLQGSGMTNSSALYFQGTSFVHDQVVYGDGLRCVTGNVLRLGTRTNSGGASQVPPVGGTPIGALGGITTPGTRFYQIIYRDNGSYCTASNFNASSGFAIAWSL